METSKVLFLAIAGITLASVLLLTVQALRDRRLLDQYPKLASPAVRMILIGIATSLLAWMFNLYEPRYCWLAFNTWVAIGFIYANLFYFGLVHSLRVTMKEGVANIQISKTQYTAVAPGVECRQYPFSGSPVVAFEQELIEIAKQYDANLWEATFLDIGRDADDRVDPEVLDFERHRYPGKRQVYYATKGAAEIIPGWPDVEPGKPFHVPPGEWHHFRRRSHFIGISLIEKRTHHNN